ncbi:hypothetical protein [Massilia glaciei]|uniref:Uncharacterized protein n=1 Tax=Massilia glaciei TaxID=1524097 RepID=A0A2U2HLH2_9BURK|nr:hypothetical protein [Massilia glaciei]PWF48343.1 hypothetical protein C7C56_012350 [Massilia glaciei]
MSAALRTLLGAVLLAAGGGANAQGGGVCGFDLATLTYAGTPRAQAACLLRPVAKWGKVASRPARLPAALAALVGEPMVGMAALERHLAARGIDEADVGGALAGTLSRANDGDAEAPAARYFVIHDTSWPALGNAARFPGNGSAALNKLDKYAGSDAVAHVFVNRKGETLTGHDFGVPWRATKFENDLLGPPGKGLYLHIELVQPRRRERSRKGPNDALAPSPGFTAAQYDKLALLYAAASARAGTWLVPAFHAVVDEGIPGAHDDPQNFELKKFDKALGVLNKALRKPPP